MTKCRSSPNKSGHLITFPPKSANPKCITACEGETYNYLAIEYNNNRLGSLSNIIFVTFKIRRKRCKIQVHSQIHHGWGLPGK